MKIIGIEYGLPSKRVGNEELIGELVERNRARLSSDDLQRLEEKMMYYLKMSGTVWRYHRANGEKAVDIALAAGEQLMRKTGISRAEIDLLIYAGVGRGWLEPAMGNLFLSQLGLKKATCFDVLDACASWIRSLLIAKSFLESGTYHNILILNSEFNFREYADFEIDRVEDLGRKFSAYTIGEAATAVLLSSSSDDPEFHISFKTWGDKHELCKIPLPNIDQYSLNGENNSHRPLRFYAESERLMYFAVKKLAEHYRDDRYLGTVFHDIIFGHAASETSTTAWLDLVRLDHKLIYRTHARFGNTVSASIPLGMALAENDGRLRRGMKALVVVGSAGVSTAFASFTY